MHSNMRSSLETWLPSSMNILDSITCHDSQRQNIDLDDVLLSSLLEMITETSDILEYRCIDRDEILLCIFGYTV